MVAGVGGCGRVEVIRPDTRGVTRAVDYRDLAAVLDCAVNAKGQVLVDSLKGVSGRLDSQLGRLAVVGPNSTPQLLATAEDRLAYYYNASAAWSLKLALLAGFPRKLSYAELRDRPFVLDGRTMTLGGIVDILMQDNDFRTAVVVPCVSLECGPLPRRPLAGGEVRRYIEENFDRYIGDPMRFAVDVENRRILFPAAIWRQRQRVTDQYNRQYHTEAATLTTALMPYVKGTASRRLQDALGYSEQPAEASVLLALPDKFSFANPWY